MRKGHQHSTRLHDPPGAFFLAPPGRYPGRIAAPSPVSSQTRRHAAFPNAIVTITEQTSTTPCSAATDDAGHYAVPKVVPGLYTLVVEASGFKKYERIDIGVAPQQCATIDDLLGVGDVTETVSVTPGAAPIETDSADTGMIIASTDIQELPFNDRNLFDLSAADARRDSR